MMMFLITGDVSLRYLFNRPIKGSVELIELMMVVLVFLAVAYTASQKGNVAIELMVARLPQRAQAIIDIITHSLSLGLVSLIIWQSVVRANYLWLHEHVSWTLSIPIYPFVFLIAFGCALLAIVLLANLLDSLDRAVRK